MASKASELRELPDEELYVRIESAKEELFNLRFQLATGQLDNSSRLKDLRHDVARTLTVLRERHLEAELEAELARVDAALLEAGRIAQMDDERTARSTGRGLVSDTQTTTDRARRKTRTGVVVSDGMDKTVLVRIDRQVRHGLYDKTVRRSSKLAAHDEGNEAHVGDTVRVVETRPISKSKRWRVVEIVERAK